MIGAYAAQQALSATKTDEFPAVSNLTKRLGFYPFWGSVASARNAWGKLFTAMIRRPLA
jgi:hypothetical protein